MRPASVPLLVFFSSILLVGFTFLPSHVSAPIANPRMTDGPLLFAYRMPGFAGVDRIGWWAWNPSKRSVWMASPEEGWAEVESNLVLWSAQLEHVPAKAWQQLSGVMNVPGMVEVAAKSVQAGTFLADVPTVLPSVPSAGPGEATASRPFSKMPLILRCGWFDHAITKRPESYEAYMDTLRNQGTTISNAITSDPVDRVFTATDMPPPDTDRM